MRALIVDDEPLARKVLREELELLPRVEIAGEADSGRSALEQIRALLPDIVFLDLQMPGWGGFDVIRRLDTKPLPMIVVVTAFDRYAIEAFEEGAVDYLLKPVGHDRLVRTLDRVARLFGKPKEIAENVAQLQEIAEGRAGATPRKIVGRSGEEYFLFSPQEVFAFQAEGDLVWIVTAKGKYQAMLTLKALHEKLPGSSFQRVHRNTIVNVNHVRKMSALSSQRWLLTLANRQEFIVSKRQAKAVREILGG